MANGKVNMTKLLPVLMAFFVMSFIDLVGKVSDRVKADLNLSDTLAQLIPSAAFLWFLLLSVPVGIIQARIGKRLMLNIGMGITALGLLVPFVAYSFAMVLVGFAFLGIGNTLVQVSANPLLVDVVPPGRASSFLSFSQFIKAIGSMVGPPLAAFLAAQFGDWKLLFLVFGIVTIISVIWLSGVRIEEMHREGPKASLASSFALLGKGFILLMVISIFIVVGIDVGFNSNSGQFLIHHLGINDIAAESGRSVYFFGKMLGTFLGAILLTKVSSRRFLLMTSALSIIILVALLINASPAVAWVIVFVTGLAVANIFPLVFAITVEKYPERSNEISGLMMMAIVGGAVIPPLMGWITDLRSTVAGMSVLVVCSVYLFIVALYCLKK